MNYSRMAIFSQVRKLRPREGGGLSKGDWDIFPGTLAPGFLMSFLPSMVINWQLLTLRINYWWKCKRLFKEYAYQVCLLGSIFIVLPKPWEVLGMGQMLHHFY